MRKIKILVADSCAGGIAVLNNIKKQFKNPEFLFLADGEKNPFGLKSKNEIVSIVEDWVRFVKRNNYDILIVACNTASIAVNSEIERLKKTYKIRIITMIDALNNAIKQLRDEVKNRNVLVFGTKFTIESNVYMALLEKIEPAKIYNIVGTESERLVARGLLRDILQIAKAKQEMSEHIDKNIDIIFLSCTCFEFVQEYLKELYPKSKIINLNEYLIRGYDNNLDYINIEYKATGALDIWRDNINAIAEIVFGERVEIDKIDIR